MDKIDKIIVDVDEKTKLVGDIETNEISMLQGALMITVSLKEYSKAHKKMLNIAKEKVKEMMEGQ